MVAEYQVKGGNAWIRPYGPWPDREILWCRYAGRNEGGQMGDSSPNKRRNPLGLRLI